MEQSATSRSSLLASATEDELFVSQILLDLRTLMSLTESLADFNWGRRKKRSCLEPPPQPPAPSMSVPAPSWPAASPENRIEEGTARAKAEDAAAQDEKEGGAARTTASPDTPLSFSPSESDEKPKHSSKKSSKKKSRKNYSDMIEGLTQRKELLTGEIENVRRYYNKLKAENLKLKAIKQEVLMQHYRIHSERRHHHQPLDSNPTLHDHRYMSGPIAAHLQDGLGSINDAGPLGIDLNLPADEAFGMEQYRPLDVMIGDKRARFAEARRKRIGIMKNKSSRSLV